MPIGQFEPATVYCLYGRVDMQDRFSSPEWSSEDWQQAWHIGVGKAYKCSVCGNMVMVVRGGTGTLEPRCHDHAMKPVETK